MVTERVGLKSSLLVTSFSWKLVSQQIEFLNFEISCQSLIYLHPRSGCIQPFTCYFTDQVSSQVNSCEETFSECYFYNYLWCKGKL